MTKSRSTAGGKKSSKKVTRNSHKTLSFLIGVITITAIAFFVFAFAQHKNYKSVLGETSNASFQR